MSPTSSQVNFTPAVLAGDGARRPLHAKVWMPRKQALLGAVTILQDAFTNSDTGEHYAEVSTKLPAHTRPERFVKVSRVGGSQDDPITDRARLLVECYGRSSRDVEVMCATASAALHNAVSSWVHTPKPPHDPPWTTGRPAALPSITDWPLEVDLDEPMFIRWCGNESGPADLAHPDILDYERWQFTIDLWVAVNS